MLYVALLLPGVCGTRTDATAGHSDAFAADKECPDLCCPAPLMAARGGVLLPGRGRDVMIMWQTLPTRTARTRCKFGTFLAVEAQLSEWPAVFYFCLALSTYFFLKKFTTTHTKGTLVTQSSVPSTLVTKYRQTDCIVTLSLGKFPEFPKFPVQT